AAELRPLLGNNQRPAAGGGCKHPGVPYDIELGWGHKGGEPFEQFQRLINDVRRSIAPAMLEPVKQPAISQKRQPFRSQRRAAHITRQALSRMRSWAGTQTPAWTL